MVVSKLKPISSIQENLLEELKQLIPEAISESKINWELLREVLGEHLEEEGTEAEHFGLNWAGKRQARRLASSPSKGTLTPVLGEGIDEENTGNIFIEGDNLEVLKLLQKSYVNRVKLIYIDPPYNTGKDFIYKDNYKDSLDDYLIKTGQVDEEGNLLTSNPKSGGRYHSNWLNMMYSRLRLARNLLREDGIIFISIDDNEVHHLRLLMNDLFGEENFIACIANVNNPKGRSDDKYIATAHENLLLYRKSDEARLNGWLPEENIIRRYNKVDDNDKLYREIDLRKTGDSDKREDRPKLFYYFLFNQKTGDFYPTRDDFVPEGYIQIYPLRADGSFGNWRCGLETSKNRLDRLIPKFMPKRQVWTVQEMDYLNDDKRVKPTSAWTKKECNSERGSEQFIELGFNKEDFPRPKPVGLLKIILEAVTESDTEDLILDFFSGSCTTAHAVIEKNCEDHGNRKFILIQLPEYIDNKNFSTISNLGKERIRRVIKKIKEEQQNQLKLDGENKQDLGFKVYKLDKSNLKIWENHQTDDLQALQTSLSLNIENPLIDGWKEEDVITEIQLIEGFPLDSKIERADVFTENRVLKVTSDYIGHKLFICLEDKLKLETIEQVKSLASEDIFICLDNALTDEAKLQLADSCNVKAL